MLTEKQVQAKIRKRAELFNHKYINQQYIEAKGIYNQIYEIVTFLEMDPDFIREIMGGYDEELDDYAPGIISKKRFWNIDRQCCEARHKEYEDRAMRRAGEPVRYYSDSSYCSRCEKNKRP